jgi:hypothetical protein
MLRPLVSRFLLPLVTGGQVHVGRPLDPKAVTALVAGWASTDARKRFAQLGPEELKAGEDLTKARAAHARTLLLDPRPPPLDENTLRLGAALHNLLLLSHPAFSPAHDERSRVKLAESAMRLADLGPPSTAAEAVRRHSLLARLPELVQPERLVSYWLGKQLFVGRTPPSRLLAMPRLRRVTVEETRRFWLREVGIPTCARAAYGALSRASPLGEALDPLRLEPAIAWGRILPILRFPTLARLVADRVIELGLLAAGGALSAALFQYASVRDGPTPATSAAGVAFGVRFLAHAVWLETLFSREDPASAGGDLGALMVAAAEVEPGLVFPPDVSPGSDAGLRLRRILAGWRGVALGSQKERFQIALGVVRYAAASAALRSDGRPKPVDVG